MNHASSVYFCRASGPARCLRWFRPSPAQTILSGLNSPVYVTNAHDGSNRLFVIEQPGRILVLQPGSSAPAVFLDIRNRVSFSGEQGLLGLTFHPRVFSEPSFFRRLHAGWRRCYSHQRISFFAGQP